MADTHAPEVSHFHTLALLRTPATARRLARVLLGFLAVVAACMFLPWQQNIRIAGSIIPLRPEERPQTVPATIAGRIARWHIQEGQFVHKGDTLLELTEVKEKYFDPDILNRLDDQLTAKRQGLAAAETKIIALDQQIAALRAGLQASLGKARNKVEQGRLKVATERAEFAAAQANFRIAQDQLARQQKLFDQGLKSLTDLEARRLKFQEAQAKLVSAENKFDQAGSELTNAQIELTSLNAEYLDKISKAESEKSSAQSYLAQSGGELAKLRTEAAGTRVRAGYYIVRAPITGFITRTLKGGIGEIVKEGEGMAIIVPEHPKMAAEVFVRPMDVPLLSHGNKIRMEFEGWPAMQFSGWPRVSVGTFGGEVNAIDMVNSTDGNYRVLVTPDAHEEGWPKELRTGGGVKGWALLNTVPVGYEIWRQMNGFRPTLKEKPKGASKAKKDKTSDADKDADDK